MRQRRRPPPFAPREQPAGRAVDGVRSTRAARSAPCRLASARSSELPRVARCRSSSSSPRCPATKHPSTVADTLRGQSVGQPAGDPDERDTDGAGKPPPPQRRAGQATAGPRATTRAAASSCRLGFEQSREHQRGGQRPTPVDARLAQREPAAPRAGLPREPVAVVWRTAPCGPPARRRAAPAASPPASSAAARRIDRSASWIGWCDRASSLIERRASPRRSEAGRQVNASTRSSGKLAPCQPTARRTLRPPRPRVAARLGRSPRLKAARPRLCLACAASPAPETPR